MNLYPHEWTQAHGASHPYCARCRFFQYAAPAECDGHPDQPPRVFTDPTIQPGDVIETPSGRQRTVDRWVVHEAARLRNGAQSLRARPLSNPRAIDWRLYVAPAEPELKILARGVAKVDDARSLLP